MMKKCASHAKDDCDIHMLPLNNVFLNHFFDNFIWCVIEVLKKYIFWNKLTSKLISCIIFNILKSCEH